MAYCRVTYAGVDTIFIVVFFNEVLHKTIVIVIVKFSLCHSGCIQ